QIAYGLPIRVQGVCEATYDENMTSSPGLIWVTMSNGISVVDLVKTNSEANSTNQMNSTSPNESPTAMGGFYATRGVVTFSDRVFGKDCLFVQEGNAAMFVSLENFTYHTPLKVGELLDLGGALKTEKSLPIITPLAFKKVGWRALPVANTDPIQSPFSPDRDGKWTELQGVVHAVNSNGTLSVM